MYIVPSARPLKFLFDVQVYVLSFSSMKTILNEYLLYQTPSTFSGKTT